MTRKTREVEESIKALRPKLLPTTAEMDLYEREVIKEVHQQLQKAVQEEKLKHCCCVIEDSKVIERCKLHGDELQKAREEERERIFGDIEQFKEEVVTMDYCDDFKDGIYATIEHILSMPVFESVLNHSNV